MQIVHRTDTYFITRWAQTLMKPFGSRLITPKQAHPAGSPEIDKALLETATISCQERQVNDINIYDLTASGIESPQPGSDAGTKTKQRIFYFPGGGWQMPASAGHLALCKSFVEELPNTSVTLISYPLAPNSPAPHTFPQLVELYRTLMKESTEAGESVTMAGDSAGGNLAVALTLHILSTHQQAEAPERLFLISPCCDLRHLDANDEETAKIATQDPILRVTNCNRTSDAWLGGWDASDPRASVIFGDVSILASRSVQVYGVTGSHDLLARGAETFRDKCSEAGVQGQWLSWEGQMHIFPLLWTLGLKESKEAHGWILKMLS